MALIRLISYLKIFKTGRRNNNGADICQLQTGKFSSASNKRSQSPWLPTGIGGERFEYAAFNGTI